MPLHKHLREQKSGHEKMAMIMRIQVFFPLFLVACLGLAPTGARASSRTKLDEKAGAVLFRDKGCAHCHGEGGIGGAKAPSLADLPKDKAWPPEKITNQILNGGQKMPSFRESLEDEEVSELVVYLKARHRPVAPVSKAEPLPPPMN
jgi:mono/diheme cytochrome c family protein